METANTLYVTIVMYRSSTDGSRPDKAVRAFFDPIAAAEWVAEKVTFPEASLYYYELLPISDVIVEGCDECPAPPITNLGRTLSVSFDLDPVEDDLYGLLRDTLLAMEGIPGTPFGATRS